MQPSCSVVQLSDSSRRGDHPAFVRRLGSHLPPANQNARCTTSVPIGLAQGGRRREQLFGRRSVIQTTPDSPDSASPLGSELPRDRSYYVETDLRWFNCLASRWLCQRCRRAPMQWCHFSESCHRSSVYPGIRQTRYRQCFNMYSHFLPQMKCIQMGGYSGWIFGRNRAENTE